MRRNTLDLNLTLVYPFAVCRHDMLQVEGVVQGIIVPASSSFTLLNHYSFDVCEDGWFLSVNRSSPLGDESA